MRRDLSLVVPVAQPYDGRPVKAAVDGASVSVDAAVARAAGMLRTCRAPAVVGLRALTIEACREAVHLAEAVRGALFVDGCARQAMPGHEPVIQTATLGHVLAAERVITVAVDEGHPVVQRLRERRVSIDAAPSDLSGVVTLRTARKAFDGAARVAVLIGPRVDPRIASQWHRLAVGVQRQVRVAVVPLPGADAANARGAAEVVTWQTGVAPSACGVDFADGAPRRGGSFDSRARRGAFDVVIDFEQGMAAAAEGTARIAIGSDDAGGQAAVRFSTPGLALGVAARVMRFDGIVLWLSDDPATAPPDPTVALLKQLREAVAEGDGQ